MTIKYQTTTDKVLALLPKEEEVTMIGGIHLPPNAKKASLTQNPIAEILVHSVGPDCKTVKPGDRVLYNRTHIGPLPVEDGELIILPEGQILAVIKKVPEPVEAPEPAASKKPSGPLTIEEIKLGLGVQKNLKDDASDLPPAAVAPVPAPASS